MASEKVVCGAYGDAHQDKEQAADGYEIREAGTGRPRPDDQTANAWAVHEPMEVMQQADVQLHA